MPGTAAPVRDAGIDYSVSHTEHWVIMAVTGRGLVGVDIEDLRAAPDPDGLARACLTSEERRHFDALRWRNAPRGWCRRGPARKRP
ncbi:hypothetical protein [Kutzneria kofuensis]|uniref:4'-phosphopantetheinyl transferase family protein n=1 Tax=Kutzneria kofuensis TaxID=103725 RepID=UPI0031E78FEE